MGLGWGVGSVLLLAAFACTPEQSEGSYERTSSSLTRTITVGVAQDTFISATAPTTTSYGLYPYLRATGGTEKIFIQPDDVRGILEANDPNNLGPAVIESAKIVLHFQEGTRGAPLIASSLRRLCPSASKIEVTSLPVATTSGVVENNPKLGSDGTEPFLVYTSYTSPSAGGPTPAELYLQRLDSTGAPVGAPELVSDDPGNLRHDLAADVSGTRIVWSSFVSTTSTYGRLRVKELTTGQTIDLQTADVPSPVARIDGTLVAWTQGLVGAYEVYAYDLSWGTSTPILLGGGPLHPAHRVEVGSRFIVWAERSNNQYDLVAYDRFLGSTAVVANDPAVHERFPSTDGDWIVWQESNESTVTIEARNMVTGERRTVANNGALVGDPSMFGNHVVYDSNVSGVENIYVYRISDGTTHQLTATPEHSLWPHIHGDNIAFVRADVAPGGGIDSQSRADVHVLHFKPPWRWDEADATRYCANWEGGYCVAGWPDVTKYQLIPGVAYPDPLTRTTSIDVTADMIEVASALDCAHPGWRIGVHPTSNATYLADSKDLEGTFVRTRPVVVLELRALEPEICGDGIDNDNSGAHDDVDEDGDGYSACFDDCNDGDPAIYQGPVYDLCDLVDNDCDGQVDEDFDGDGYGACNDCNDSWSTIHPGAAEICDGLDNNCDGSVDAGCGTCISPANCNNQACVNGSCGSCTSDADCGSPWRCFGGACYEPPS